MTLYRLTVRQGYVLKPTILLRASSQPTGNDKEFVRLLLIEKMIDVNILTKRISSLNVKEPLLELLLQWVKVTAEELEAQE